MRLLLSFLHLLIIIAEVGVEAEYKPVEKRKTEELTKHSAGGSRHYVLPIV